MINEKITKNMIFNFTKNFQFNTRLELKGEKIDTIQNTKLLGTIISDDLRWDLTHSYVYYSHNICTIMMYWSITTFCQGPIGHFCVATTTTAPGHKNWMGGEGIFKAAMADRILEVNLV